MPLEKSDQNTDRVCHLVDHGWLVVTFAQEHRLPRKTRLRLLFFFRSECMDVLSLVGKISRFTQSLTAQDQFQLYKHFELLTRKLVALVKEYLFRDKKIPPKYIPYKFAELSAVMAELLQRASFMLNIEQDAWKRDFLKSLEQSIRNEADLATDRITLDNPILDQLEKTSPAGQNKCSDYIPCHLIPKYTPGLKKRSDSIIRTLRLMGCHVEKRGNKCFCNPVDAAMAFPAFRRYWKKIGEKPENIGKPAECE